MSDSRPLADILRPQTLDDVVGQDHLVGKDGILRKLLTSEFLPSMIFWGPPGVGKTTLAHLLATLTNSEFVSKSAVTMTLADLRQIVKDAKVKKDAYGKRTVLFIDEIHRFNKAQQDALLPHVEHGTIIFIGATTENPSFEVISALLSRSRVLLVHTLDTPSLSKILAKGLVHVGKKISDEAKNFLLEVANGDARTLLNILEIAAKFAQKTISLADVETGAQKSTLVYDRAGEEHYNTISAFIKSMRASDVDAALYYLARMVASGEDPLFIARRMVVFASEDIGMAQPTALVVANAVFDACHKIGYPEAQINLAHGVVYLATAHKDRSSYEAYFAALEDVKKLGNLPIPYKIRNAPTKLMKDIGYGKGYEKYPSVDQTGTTESLLPDALKGKVYLDRKTK